VSYGSPFSVEWVLLIVRVARSMHVTLVDEGDFTADCSIENNCVELISIFFCIYGLN